MHQVSEANRLTVKDRLDRANNGKRVFLRRRDIAANPAESLGALTAPKSAGDFLLDFAHPDIPLRLIRVGSERSPLDFAPLALGHYNYFQ